ncbi:MAG: hypothetical protein GY950_04375 [bacterium]|nr:hypothetical protein [bacterium]
MAEKKKFTGDETQTPLSAPSENTFEKMDNEMKTSDKEKTKVAPPDLPYAPDETIIPSTDEMDGILTDEITGNKGPDQDEFSFADSQQETVVTKGDDDLDISKEKTVTEEKTISLFGLSDIQQKLDNEIANIPDDYQDQIEPEQMSIIIKDHFPQRTDAEKIKINRNFLTDAEPFKIESLAEDIKKSPEGTATGFKSLDQFITIPPDALTVIAARPKHGKSCFLLNMLLNMCGRYKDKHFMFYTYEDPKSEIMIKLINMCGTKQFPRQEGLQTNLERWKHEFLHTGIDALKAKADEEIEYSGLKYFMEISSRIHVVDTDHPCLDLVDSIQSFAKAFDVGAVFIDSLPKIRLENERNHQNRRGQLHEISNHLRKLAYETRFPLVVSAPLTPGPKNSPEYDDLCEENLAEAGNPDQNAGLVIGLQNYARSRFLGSDFNPLFKSNFYGQPLKKAELMPENFKDMMQKTILLAKVIANKSGAEPETELLFHKQLLRIFDFQDDTPETSS